MFMNGMLIMYSITNIEFQSNGWLRGKVVHNNKENKNVNSILNYIFKKLN